MNISSLSSGVNAAELPLEQLSTNSHLSEKEKVGELARQFETLLVRQILAEANKPVFKSTFDDNSTAGSIYRDMITGQMADGISKSGGLGLSRTLSEQLSRQVQSHE